MSRNSFHPLIRRIRGLSRRDVARALLFAATAIRLTPVRVARAEQEGAVVLGGACATSRECRQRDLQAEAICADNGFTSDGRLNCCVESYCCETDADCCGDLRCSPTSRGCPVCRQPPFPTRVIGQVCASVRECIPALTCEIDCIASHCVCRDDPDGAAATRPADLLPIPDDVTALATAEALSFMEVTGDVARLYERLHPDAKAIVSPAVVAGWYQDAFPYPGERAAVVAKVRFIPWTWPVTGQTYPETAEVATRQTLYDGTLLRDEVRLVKDPDGNWAWFFGRERAFVEEQIARYGS